MRTPAGALAAPRRRSPLSDGGAATSSWRLALRLLLVRRGPRGVGYQRAEVATGSTRRHHRRSEPPPGGRRARPASSRRGGPRAAPPRARRGRVRRGHRATAASSSGRDAATGAEDWSYRRDRRAVHGRRGLPRAPTTATATSSPSTKAAPAGAASSPRCARSTGTRVGASNPDVRPGTELLADGTYVLATGDRLPGGRGAPTSSHPGVRRRPHARAARPAAPAGLRLRLHRARRGRIGVVERCPDEHHRPAHRAHPRRLGRRGHTRRCSSRCRCPPPARRSWRCRASRAAVALPGPPRLHRARPAGLQVGLVPLDVPDADLATDPPGRAPSRPSDHRRPASTGGRAARTSRSTAATLTPAWTLPAPSARPALRRRPPGPRPRRARRRSTPSAAPRCARSPCRAPTAGRAGAGSRPRAKCCWSSAAPRVVGLTARAVRRATARSAAPEHHDHAAATTPPAPGAVGEDRCATTATTAVTACTRGGGPRAR